MHNVNHELLTLEGVAEILSHFAFENKGVLPTSETVFQMYPMLKGNIQKNEKNLQSKIEKLIKKQYEQFIDTNKNIVSEYSELINKYKDDFFETLNNYFEIEKEYNINAYIGLLPVCPRDIKKETYCITKTETNIIIDIFMHESCHFAFFKKCKDIFSNFEDDDMNRPSLLWYLSEIVIDPILNSKEFQKIFAHKFYVYDVFYEIKINEVSIINIIREIFDTNDSKDAIIKSYEFLRLNEKEFRNLTDPEFDVQNKKFLVIQQSLNKL